jgi:hypothetical protein
MRISQINKLIRRTMDFIASVQSWNDNRADAAPIDCEDMRVLLDLLLRQRNALVRGDRREALLINCEIIRYAEQLQRVER